MGTRQRGRMSLLVRNLKFQTSPDRVREIFERFGPIRDVYLPLDYNTKRPRGFGFVEFHDERDTTSALDELDQCEIDGNRIEVTMAQRGRSSPDAMRSRENPQYRGGGGGRNDRHRSDNRDGGGRNRRSRSRSRSKGRGPARRGRSPSWDRRRERSGSRDRRREKAPGGFRRCDDDREDRRGGAGGAGGAGGGGGGGGRDMGRERFSDDRRGAGFDNTRDIKRRSLSGSRRREWRNDNNQAGNQANPAGVVDGMKDERQPMNERTSIAERSNSEGNVYSGADDPARIGEVAKETVGNVGTGDAGSRGESRSRSPRC
eukprot:GHVS01009229.1.p1 GENE.GHVS01009229.1~~GHVS01009229.1.p1  ORF type:complete len:316 (+),score=46.04 GHVS01009229.1:33-980(+)